MLKNKKDSLDRCLFCMSGQYALSVACGDSSPSGGAFEKRCAAATAPPAGEPLNT